MTNFFVLSALALAIFIGGMVVGNRYAEGRAAVARQEHQAAVEAHLTAALEEAADHIKAANDKVLKATKAIEALEVRQTKERIIYVKAPAAPACRLDDSTFGLLNDAVRRANDRASINYSD